MAAEPAILPIRESLVRTNFSPNSEKIVGSSVPMSLNDVYVIDEQLPYAYFFKERLCDETLQSSLERVLKHFPVLGGRLSLDSLSIELDSNDTVPFAVGTTEICADEWIRMRHESPENLLPLFDPLPRDPWNSPSPLARVRVTHIGENEGTVIGVNISHAAADGASCIDFMYCWGREHRHLRYPTPSNDRSLATTNGMLTPSHKDLLNLGQQEQTPSALGILSSQILGFSSAILSGTSTPDSSESSNSPVEHEFVLLRFTPELLKAMKKYGANQCSDRESGTSDDEHPSFVSTNDLVTGE